MDVLKDLVLECLATVDQSPTSRTKRDLLNYEGENSKIKFGT
jgi:hypothetical protein